MTRIKTIIVDDEPLARKGIEALLQRDAEIEVVGSYSNGKKAIKAIAEKSPDLLFLDIQMPGMDGFQVLSKIATETMPVVVFVTAYDEYALQAFQVHALDYLLKSYSDEQFTNALARAKQHIREKRTRKMTDRLFALMETHKETLSSDRTSGENQAENYLERLVIKERGRVFFIKTAEIDWIESADYYVCLHVNKKSHLLREAIKGLAKRLDPSKFQRVHRSTIVNLDRIKELQPYQHGDYIIILHDGTKLKLSRNYRSNLETALGSSV